MEHLRALERRLAAYLMVEGSPWPLGIFRVILGASICFDARENLKRVNFYTPDAFHFPYFDFIVPLSPEQLLTLFDWEFTFAVMLLLGLATPVAAAGVLLTQGYVLLICQLNFRNHIYLTLLMTLLVMISPAWRVLSVDGLLRWAWFRLKGEPERAAAPRWVTITTQRLIGLQVSIAYLYAALHKLNPGFLTGYPLSKALSKTLPRSYVVREGYLAPETAQWLADRVSEPSWSALVAYLTIFSEGFLALGLLFRSTRLAAVIVGVGLHLSIGLSMDILTFGVLMVGGYVCFWAPRLRPIAVSGQAPPALEKSTEEGR